MLSKLLSNKNVLNYLLGLIIFFIFIFLIPNLGGGFTQIDFDTEFLSNDLNKFARKFGLYNFDDEKISIYADGYLDLTRSRLKLKKVVRDRSQLIGKSQIMILEKSLNENVLNEGVLGILDFFKFKKFFQEVL